MQANLKRPESPPSTFPSDRKPIDGARARDIQLDSDKSWFLIPAEEIAQHEADTDLSQDDYDAIKLAIKNSGNESLNNLPAIYSLNLIGDKETIERILQNLTPEAINMQVHGVTLLHAAVTQNWPADYVKALLEHKHISQATIDAKMQGSTALHIILQQLRQTVPCPKAYKDEESQKERINAIQISTHLVKCMTTDTIKAKGIDCTPFTLAAHAYCSELIDLLSDHASVDDILNARQFVERPNTSTPLHLQRATEESLANAIKKRVSALDTPEMAEGYEKFFNEARELLYKNALRDINNDPCIPLALLQQHITGLRTSPKWGDYHLLLRENLLLLNKAPEFIDADPEFIDADPRFKKDWEDSANFTFEDSEEKSPDL